MTLSRAQRALVAAGLVVMAGLAAFPTWRCVEQRIGEDGVTYAYAPLWAPPERVLVEGSRWDCDDARVAGDRLLASWGVVATAAIALVLAVGAWRSPKPSA